MLDQDTETAMATVELDDATHVEQWFQAICQTYTDKVKPVTDWDSFKENLKSGAARFNSNFDSDFVEKFIEKIEKVHSDPIRAIEDMSKNGLSDLVQAYPALLEKKRAGAESKRAEDSDADTLHWVTEEQRTRLNGKLGQQWQTVVRTKLTEVWPPWRQAGTTALVQFLDQWMNTILAETPTAASDVESLFWVTEEQRTRLDGKLGQQWQTVVRTKLTEVWPPWRQAGTTALVQFLDQWMNTILAEAPTPTALSPQIQDILTSDEGRAALEEMREYAAAVVAENPEFGGIHPQRRQDLITQAVAERLS